LSLFSPRLNPESEPVPIYEYLCDACGERVEVMQKISERPLKQCPGCKQNRLRKLVSASAFRLKGSGWYETDFKKGGKKNVSSSADESGAEKGDKDKEKEKKPAKTEEKAETKESTAESKPAPKEKDKDKSAGKSDTGKTKTPKKPAGD
jgi:putative FmdB family regulatory protein